RYWSDKLKFFLSSEKDYLNLSKIISCIEYFPYHSKNYKPQKNILYSQKYNFYLVRNAIKRNAIIILMRGKKEWLNAVPELKKYNNLFYTKSPQNVILSPNNLYGDSFYKIKEIIEG
ncbi:MAG: hypothetical protein ACOCZ6_05120, partial [Nanoarchaeota archaeon]